MAGQPEITRLRAQADEFAVLVARLEALRCARSASDTESMRRLIRDCRLWSRNLRRASSYLECVSWWYRRQIPAF